ncbi:hypothetical protein [Chitinophaga caseinilytica]|uniref:Methyltransferase FkbM domain-containing protein n=1 Tax=Chitinophaga caseinilytica TaxID=2267521 RepID=A0ABZ2YXF6_9BACT
MSKIKFLSPVHVKNKIRLGRNHDGGYVVYEKAIQHTDRLLTYGVGWETSFEEDFNSRTGKPVLMFDPTMFNGEYVNMRHFAKLMISFRFRKAKRYLSTAKKWKKKLTELNERNIVFVDEGIAPEKNGKYNSLEQHMKQYRLFDENVLLKIDIEGGEYGLLDHPKFLACLGRVNQLIFEFHDLKNRLREVESILRLLEREFTLIHVHGNNYGDTFYSYEFSGSGTNDVLIPDVLELTLVRKTVLQESDIVHEDESYPVPQLDFPNNPQKKDIPIHFV